MAARLTDTWNQHAFPDDAPGREEFWSLDSERRRVADRTDFDLEQSGSTNKIRRFTSGRDDAPDGRAAKEKAADDMMTLLVVGSPAYMRAYNTQLTFQIDGQDIEMTQGRLHDLAKRRAEDLHRQINAAKQRGASAEETARLKDNLDAYRIIRDNADPRLGSMTPDRHAAVTAAMNRTPDVRNHVVNEGSIFREIDNAKAQEGDMSLRMDKDGDMQSGGVLAKGGVSVAGAITDDPLTQNSGSLTRAFTSVAPNAPVMPETHDDQPAPAVSQQQSGFGPA